MVVMVKSEHVRRPVVPTARQVFLAPSAASPEQQDERERAFFTSIRLPNGAYKTTYPRRLDDLNELILPLLPAERPLHLMDVGVSTGVTTWEWSMSLRNAGIDHSLTAGDLTIQAYLLSVGHHLHALIDQSGYPWQFEVRGQAIPNPPGNRHWLRHFPGLLLLKRAIRRSFQSLQRAVREQGNQPVRTGSVSCQPVPLVSPLLRQSPNVSIIEDDVRILNPTLSHRFHVLRAANVLNKYHFDDATLTVMLTNLRSRLKMGGLLVVCRTDEQRKNDGTVFRLESSGLFTTIARLGAGAEVETLVLTLPPPP